MPRSPSLPSGQHYRARRQLFAKAREINFACGTDTANVPKLRAEPTPMLKTHLLPFDKTDRACDPQEFVRCNAISFLAMHVKFIDPVIPYPQ